MRKGALLSRMFDAWDCRPIPRTEREEIRSELRDELRARVEPRALSSSSGLAERRKSAKFWRETAYARARARASVRLSAGTAASRIAGARARGEKARDAEAV